MTSSISYQIDNQKLDTKKNMKTGLDRFLDAAQNQTMSGAGGFDIMNFIKRVSSAFHCNYLDNKAGGYLDGFFVVNLYPSIRALVDRFKQARSEKMDAQKAFEIGRQCSETASTACYAGAFFIKKPQLICKAASVTDVLYDASDFGVVATRFCDMSSKLKRAKEAPIEIKQALQSEKTRSLIDIIRTVSAVVTSIIMCWTAWAGVALFPVVAATTAIVNSVFVMLSYYHKNYWTIYPLKIC